MANFVEGGDKVANPQQGWLVLPNLAQAHSKLHDF